MQPTRQRRASLSATTSPDALVSPRREATMLARFWLRLTAAMMDRWRRDRDREGCRIAMAPQQSRECPTKCVGTTLLSSDAYTVGRTLPAGFESHEHAREGVAAQVDRRHCNS